MLAALRFSEAILFRTIERNISYVKRTYMRCSNYTTSYSQLLEKDVTAYTSNKPPNTSFSVVGLRNKDIKPLSQSISSEIYEDNVRNNDTFRFIDSPDCNTYT